MAITQCQPSADRVDTQRFDPRGYAEFPDNCPFSNLLQRYFGSDKIYILHRMNGKIPDFAYIDLANNLYIDIEIDEPYTPRQYPRRGGQLKLTHCLGQYDYEDRDRLFINYDWFVIHFSERQIICWSESCFDLLVKVEVAVSSLPLLSETVLVTFMTHGYSNVLLFVINRLLSNLLLQEYHQSICN